jgi:hypothetical protein
MSKIPVPRVNRGKYDMNILKNNNIYYLKKNQYIWVGNLQHCTDNICVYDNLNLNLNGEMSLYYDVSSSKNTTSKNTSSKNASSKNASGPKLKKRRKSIKRKSNKKRK